jgi:papain like protease
MTKVASGARRRLSRRRLACGTLAVASVLATQVGCHGKGTSAGSEPSPSPVSTAPSPTEGTVAQAIANATEPYWSPDHVLVLPNSLEAQDNKALNELITRQGGKCGLREVAEGVYATLQCTPFEPISGARDVMSPQKMDMLKKGKLHFSRGSPIPKGDRTEILPDNVDHRVDNFEGPVKNQGAVGACTAFSLSTVMDNAIMRLQAAEDAGPPGPKDPRDAKEAAGWAMSPLHIWARYGTPSMKSAGEAMLHKEVAPLSVWPYSPRQACQLEKGGGAQCGEAYHVRAGSGLHDPAIEHSLANANREWQYKVAQIDKITTKPVNPDAIAAVLATGSDVWIGINIDGHAWQHLKGQNAVIPDWRQNEGGHAVALAGYRKGPNGKRQFLVHNSWGGTWGDHGFGWVNEEMIEKHLEYAYAIRIEDKSGKSPPQTDDACPEKELIDADTGQCAPMCPDNTRRVNGECEGGSPPSNPGNPSNPSNPGHHRRH